MDKEENEFLSDAIKEYFGDYELGEICSRFGLAIECNGVHPNRKKLVAQLISQKYRDRHQRMSLRSVFYKLAPPEAYIKYSIFNLKYSILNI